MTAITRRQLGQTVAGALATLALPEIPATNFSGFRQISLGDLQINEITWTRGDNYGIQECYDSLSKVVNPLLDKNACVMGTPEIVGIFELCAKGFKPVVFPCNIAGQFQSGAVLLKSKSFRPEQLMISNLTAKTCTIINLVLD